jgi:hypothetical protein
MERGAKQRVLDPCCGSRMFWFDKSNPEAVFGDIRRENAIFHDKRTGRRPLVVAPDIVVDFTDLPFRDGMFHLVVFDPPHLDKSAGDKGWQALKYGKLPRDWRAGLTKGFSECFRVLSENGVLIFKWSEVDISLREVLSLTDVAPLFGQTTTVNLKTHWIVFMKPIS